ncbi:hypothetical protein LAZ67_10002352 [Cordylochernes scorpioides]|uniref:Uncharacterized protein n=1 Tax=Cordylochernes scorpioides TaxID=51811 RepID=A0ABY6L0F1_9ARAC|nr:hypothetical protein LAZ67_10002352 [Cordylochernes scorpioides]
MYRNGAFEGKIRLLSQDQEESSSHLTDIDHRFHRRVKAKTSFQDEDVPIDDMTTKPLFMPQEKGGKDTKDKVPKL